MRRMRRLDPSAYPYLSKGQLSHNRDHCRVHLAADRLFNFGVPLDVAPNAPSTQWKRERTPRFFIRCVIQCSSDATSDAKLSLIMMVVAVVGRSLIQVPRKYRKRQKGDNDNCCLHLCESPLDATSKVPFPLWETEVRQHKRNQDVRLSCSCCPWDGAEITLTAGALLQEEKKPSLVVERQFRRHLERPFWEVSKSKA